MLRFPQWAELIPSFVLSAFPLLIVAGSVYSYINCCERPCFLRYPSPNSTFLSQSLKNCLQLQLSNQFSNFLPLDAHNYIFVQNFILFFFRLQPLKS